MTNLIAGEKYRVTRDDNRAYKGGVRYVATGTVGTLKSDELDTDGEVELLVVADDSLLGHTYAYLVPDALERVSDTPADLDEKVLAVALDLHDVTSVQVGVLMDVLNTYNKIKEALA